MKKETTQSIKNLLVLHAVTAVFNAAAAVIAGAYVTYEYFEFTSLSILLGMGTSFLVLNVLNLLAAIVLAALFYGPTTKQDLKDAINTEYSGEDPEEMEDDGPEFNEVSIKIIETPEKPIGSFMGSQFFEWLDIEDTDSKVKRFWFHGTVNMQQGLQAPLPDGSFLIPPGILYNSEVPT